MCVCLLSLLQAGFIVFCMWMTLMVNTRTTIIIQSNGDWPAVKSVLLEAVIIEKSRNTDKPFGVMELVRSDAKR